MSLAALWVSAERPRQLLAPSLRKVLGHYLIGRLAVRRAFYLFLEVSTGSGPRTMRSLHPSHRPNQENGWPKFS
jgi:hypothetical protein